MLQKYIIQFIYENRIDYAKDFIEKNLKDNYRLYNYYMGLCSCYENNYDSAIIYFKRAINSGLVHSIVFYNLGVAYIEVNNIEHARRCFIDSINLNIKFVKSYENLAYIYYKKGKIKEAYQIIKTCLSITDDYEIKEIERKLLYLMQKK